jgi:hypothetical protein
MSGLQTREEPGAVVRSRTAADVRTVLARSGLADWERGRVLELVEAALSADHREPLGGATLLQRSAQQERLSPGVAATLDQLAVAFLRPRTGQ